MKPEARLTQKFLKCISDHLSGRPECRKLEYRVAIGVQDPKMPSQVTFDELVNPDYNVKDHIYFYPPIDVYPSTHNRKKSDLQSILHHAIFKHYADELFDKSVDGSIYVKTDKLVPGVYIYQLSMNGKRRRWIRVR